MQKHFVVFLSPGTFVDEESMREIDSWDTAMAMEMAGGVLERHGATPYGFRFITRARGPEDLDSMVVARSRTYFLGGKVETLEEVEARNDPAERILRLNMKTNGFSIVVNTNSWKTVKPLMEGDVVLDWTQPERPVPVGD